MASRPTPAYRAPVPKGREAHPAGRGEPPRHLRLVPPGYRTPRARRRRAGLVGLAVAAVVALGLIGLVASHVALTQGQLQVDRLRAQVEQEQARNARLRLQVAHLESPGWIVAEAQRRLGMQPPAQVTYLSPAAGSPSSPTP